jgi:thiopurine S-methyltransferase
MREKFWLDLWQKNDIAFHKPVHNELLLQFWPELQLNSDASVFVPMCGKSLDMRWFESQGHPVIGVELARLAVDAYFVEGQENPKIDVVERFERSVGRGTTIYQGDFFDVTAPLLESVQGLFDRGALVALPADMRFRYVDHLLRIIPDGTRMLLITFEYDQDMVTGPPHSVTPEEVEQLYGGRCDIELLETFVTSALPERFAAHQVPQAAESVYRIVKVD